jgi:hypothetical protein
MTSLVRSASLALAVLVLGATPFYTQAHSAQASANHLTAKSHTLPKGTGSATVFRFGVKGGSLRPWSVTISLDGTITAIGATTHQRLTDPTNALKGLMALADAEGYFTLKKSVGCLSGAGNPDVSTRFISIHTATGTKGVQEFGSCAATATYDQLYAVLEGSAGIGS